MPTYSFFAALTALASLSLVGASSVCPDGDGPGYVGSIPYCCPGNFAAFGSTSASCTYGCYETIAVCDATAAASTRPASTSATLSNGDDFALAVSTTMATPTGSISGASASTTTFTNPQSLATSCSILTVSQLNNECSVIAWDAPNYLSQVYGSLVTATTQTFGAPPTANAAPAPALPRITDGPCALAMAGAMAGWALF